MCYTYDKSKGGDTRELQSRMVPPPKKTGSSHLNVGLLVLIYRILTSQQGGNSGKSQPS